jgi:hypothetical protein
MIMANLDMIHEQKIEGESSLSFLFSFKATKKLYYRTMRFDRNETPIDVANRLRRLADDIENDQNLLED